MTVSDLAPLRRGTPRAFVTALVLNTIWINLSEVFRYFAFVMPMMREALPGVPDVAPMNLPVFLIWGVWDTILVVAATGFAWLILERFGRSAQVAIAAGSAVWAAVFVVLWLGLWNMNLATTGILAVALPLAWVEMVVAALIVRWAMR
jgi:hypothetical protein